MTNSKGSIEIVESYMYKDLDSESIASSYSALKSGQTHYVDVPGVPEVREAAAEWVNGYGVINAEKDNIIITSGLQESRFLATQVVTSPEGQIAIPAVANPGASLAASLRGCHVENVACDEETGLLSSDALESDVVSASQTIFLENPSRVTGAIYSNDFSSHVNRFIEQGKHIVVDTGLSPWLSSVDNMYKVDVSSADGSIIAIGELWPGLGIEPQGLGFIAAPLNVAEKIVKMKQVLSICTSTPAQFAALELSGSWKKMFNDSKSKNEIEALVSL